MTNKASLMKKGRFLPKFSHKANPSKQGQAKRLKNLTILKNAFKFTKAC